MGEQKPSLKEPCWGLGVWKKKEVGGIGGGVTGKGRKFLLYNIVILGEKPGPM